MGFQRILITTIILLGVTISAHAGSKDVCVEAYDFTRGGFCGNPRSTHMRVKNICSERIDMKFCLKRADGRWSCGVQGNVGRGEGTTWYVCEGDGFQTYFTEARESGSGERFAEPR